MEERPGRAAEGVSLEELKAYCKTNFTGYKVPKHIVLRESLPMTPCNNLQGVNKSAMSPTC